MTFAAIRADAPAFDEGTYLNTGASGPSPRRVVDAIDAAQRDHEFRSPTEEGMYPAAFAEFDETRAAFADLLGADEGEVALTQSTTDGINRIATALDWDADDVVVRTDLEHPAGILPWKRLRETVGVDVRVVETHEGRLDLDAVRDAVEGATLVCLSSLTWTHGTRLPVGEVVDVAHDAGALVLVDAVQSVGQVPVDVHEWGADAVAAASHKWLLGPWGAGMLYVADDVADRFAPSQVGYMGVDDPHADTIGYRDGARRFEIGTTAPAPYAGAREAVELWDEVGIDAVTDRVADLTDHLKSRLPDDALLSPREYESGLVSVAVDDPEATVERLDDAGVVARTLPGMDAVRASVHAVNTVDDLDRFVDAL